MQDKTISFEIIRELVKGCLYEELGYKDYIKCFYNGKDISLWNCSYLLNQVLRQISIGDDKKLVSKAAKELWEKIDPECKKNSSKNINDYYYREVLTAGKEGAKIYEYKGSNKNPNSDSPRELKKGASFVFRDVFHVEHVVPISMIIKRLKELEKNNQLTDDAINETLELIYVCRMTKQEDRGIKQKSKRFLDVDRVLNEVYKNKENKLIIEVER